MEKSQFNDGKICSLLDFQTRHQILKAGDALIKEIPIFARNKNVRFDECKVEPFDLQLKCSNP